MKPKYIILILFLVQANLYSQDFEKFDSLFVEMPYNSESLLFTSSDTTYKNKPVISSELIKTIKTNGNNRFINISGDTISTYKLNSVDQDSINYNDGEDKQYISKIYAIGKVNLNNQNIYIIAWRHFEGLDVFGLSFNNSGLLVSAIVLVEFKGYPSSINRLPIYNFVLNQDGNIIQSFDGYNYDRERLISLDSNKIFVVISENKTEK